MPSEIEVTAKSMARKNSLKIDENTGLADLPDRKRLVHQPIDISKLKH